MISLIVPTYNRAYALKLVLDTFYTQKHLSEVVFVDDCSDDETFDIINSFKEKYPQILTTYLKNPVRSGASYSRSKGVEACRFEYVLFCDDDEFLEGNYTEVCLKKLKNARVDIVSGRHLYRNVGEGIKEAITRFGYGLSESTLFGKIRFKVYTDARFEGDMEIPFTHGIFMTTKSLLKKYEMDPYYSKGNGFREESDFQMNAFLNGHKIIMTNDTHCVHMNMKEVRTGGQRVNRLKRYWYNVFYTHYFLKKYYQKIQKKLELPYSFSMAIFFYAVVEFYDFFIRPFGILSKRALGIK